MDKKYVRFYAVYIIVTSKSYKNPTTYKPKMFYILTEAEWRKAMFVLQNDPNLRLNSIEDIQKSTDNPKICSRIRNMLEKGKRMSRKEAQTIVDSHSKMIDITEIIRKKLTRRQYEIQVSSRENSSFVPRFCRI